jgi:flagellar motor switch protein FliM
VPVLDCHYGTSNGKYALKVDQLLAGSREGWLGENNVH